MMNKMHDKIQTDSANNSVVVGYLVVITGPNYGKSKLVHEFVRISKQKCDYMLCSFEQDQEVG